MNCMWIRKINNPACCILLVVTVVMIAGGCSTYGKISSSPETTIVFEPEEGTYASMRIPALVLTKAGTLLAFCEGRIGTASDWAEMDLLMRRSTDGGKHWEPYQVIAPRQHKAPASNATPIVDSEGRIHLLYQRDYAQAYYTRSVDDGKTWSEPQDITYAFDAFKPEYDWKVLAPGPGHSIQLKNGRLLVAVWLADPAKLVPHRSHYPSRIATIYSDDTGRTWKRGALVPDGPSVKNPSETMAVQLDDGRVMLNIRHSSDIHQRGISYSADGISGWTIPTTDTALFEPICMASIIRVPANGIKQPAGLLFINPDSRDLRGDLPKYPRKNLTAKVSFDEGKHWPVRRVLDTAAAGYNDVAVSKEGMVYCLYETNTVGKGWNYSLVLKRFPLAWITGSRKKAKTP